MSVSAQFAPSDATVVCVELRLADVDFVADIENRSFPEPWSAEDLITAIGDPSAISIGLRIDGDLVGFSIGYLDEATFHLATLAIVPAHRGLGRGSLLLRSSLQCASRRGCDRCTLEVRRSNSVARRLYVRHGFTADDIRWNYYRNPRDHAVLMSRSLN